MVLLRCMLKSHYIRPIFENSKAFIQISPQLNTFWVRDKKGGYKDNRTAPTTRELISDGFKELKQEIKIWSEEVKDHFDGDPLMVCRPGETDVTYRFETKEALNNWVVTSDSMNNEGFSTAKLELSKHGKGLFSGNLSTMVPKDGRIKRAGYCNINTVPYRKSFKREAYMDWTSYNMLVMKVRGDGRSYILNISSKGYFDIMWNDMYHYIIFTRGGPYWQIAKIPFSKFFLSSRGRIQDKQYPVPLNRITGFGISVGDKINGSFNLEIDYIGLEYDPNHREEFAYEMYQTEKYIAST